MEQWKTKVIKTKRGTFEIFLKGQGKPLCVTHHYSSFNSSGDYFADTFTKHFKVILVNLKGAGNSVKSKDDHELSMNEAVKDLEAIREALGYETWFFAGHSTGGMIGLRYGIDASHSLSKLMIVGSAATRNYAEKDDCIYHPNHTHFTKMQQLIEQLKSQNLSAESRMKLSNERTKLSLYQANLFPIYFNKGIIKMMCTARMNYFATKEYQSFEWRDELKQITSRTFIVCGVHDVQCPIRCSEEIFERVQNANLYKFDYSNHYPFLEEKEKFNTIIEKFANYS